MDSNPEQSKSKRRDPDFSFSEHKDVVVLLFQYHFYVANDFSLETYQERILHYQFKKIVYQILCAIIENYKQILQIINQNIHAWEFGRLGTIERALLSLGCYYLVINKRYSAKIIIYFCIKHAQQYCEEKAYRLINKVLDNIYQAQKNNIC